jgi:outer membrane protein assembly factor BamB
MRKSLLLTISMLAVLMLVAGCRNKPPRIPAKPGGLAHIGISDTATYASFTTDPNRDRVLYAFDWGDGTADTSDFIKSGDTIRQSHTWSALGLYPVKLMAKDEKGKWSADWSDTLNVSVGNRPPKPPDKPTIAGVDSITYPIAVTSSATDPDGDSVQIKFYFGEAGTPTYGPRVASGAPFTDTVVYSTKGWKTVRAVARDVNGDTSEWSEPDSIYMHTPNVIPYAPTIVTRYTPQRGIADGPAYRFYANSSDQYFDSLYYRFYFDGTDSVMSGLFPSGVDGYVEWTPTGDTHTYNVKVRVFDQTGKTNDTLAETTFKTVAEGEVVWSIPGEFVASPALGTVVWRGESWPAIIIGSLDEYLYVFDTYQGFIANTIVVDEQYDYNSSAAIGADGTRYVGNENGGFYAVGPNDTVKWRFGTGDAPMSATAALGNGGIYCGGEDHRIHKLVDNGSSVTEAWSYLLRFEMTSSPAIGPDGKVYCCDDSGYVYCLNDDGTLSWEVLTAQDLNKGITSSPAIASDGTVYVGTEAGRLHALKDGAIVWTYETDPRRPISSSPVVGPDGNIYLTCDDGKLYRIDQDSHQPVTDWPVVVSDSLLPVNSTPLLCADGIIYVADDDSLYAFDVDNPTGGRRWAVELYIPPEMGSGHGPPRLSFDNQPSAAVDQYGTVYIATESGDGGIFAIAGRPTGTLAATDWPMFHHDPKHTGRFGAR